MSLINDALKRASQSTAATTTEASTLELAARPVETKRKPSLWPVIVFPAFLLAITGVAGWFLVKHLRAESPVNASARQSDSAAASPEQTSPRPVSEKPEGNAGQNVATATLPGEKTTVQTSNETTSVAAPPPPAPIFKLQGIFYKPVQPLAMINGRTVGIGDKVLNGKIVAIRRDSVSVFVDGQTKVLTLPTNN